MSYIFTHANSTLCVYFFQPSHLLYDWESDETPFREKVQTTEGEEVVPEQVALDSPGPRLAFSTQPMEHEKCKSIM